MTALRDAVKRVVNNVAFDTNRLAKTLAYNVIDSGSTSISYLDGESANREVEEADGLYRLRERSVFIPSTAGVGIAAPNVLDTVTIDSEEWAIKAFTHDNVATHKLEIERRELIKKLRR